MDLDFNILQRVWSHKTYVTVSIRKSRECSPRLPLVGRIVLPTPRIPPRRRSAPRELLRSHVHTILGLKTPVQVSQTREKLRSTHRTGSSLQTTGTGRPTTGLALAGSTLKMRIVARKTAPGPSSGKQRMGVFEDNFSTNRATRTIRLMTVSLSRRLSACRMHRACADIYFLAGSVTHDFSSLKQSFLTRDVVAYHKESQKLFSSAMYDMQ